MTGSASYGGFRALGAPGAGVTPGRAGAVFFTLASRGFGGAGARRRAFGQGGRSDPLLGQPGARGGLGWKALEAGAGKTGYLRFGAIRAVPLPVNAGGAAHGDGVEFRFCGHTMGDYTIRWYTHSIVLWGKEEI